MPSVFTACDVCLRINGLHIAAGWKQIYGLMLHWIGLAPNERFRAMEETLRPLIAEA